MTDKQIVAKLRRKSGKTASELGITIVQARKLEASGVIEREGVRRLPQRGRPAIEWRAVA